MASANTEQLQALLRLSSSAGDPKMKVVLSRLSSEIKERCKGQANSSDYFVSALRALSKVRGTGHAELRMQCVRDCLFFFYTSGLLKEGLEATEQLKYLAEATQDKSWTRVAQTLAGIIYGDMGNVAEAVLHYSRALEIAVALGDIDAEISVLVNLGSALNYGGLYGEAIPCFVRATSICRAPTSSHQAYKASALCNLAQSYFSLGRTKDAYEAITVAIELSIDPCTAFDSYNRTVREFTFVRLALEHGDVPSARARVQECRRFATQCGSSRAFFLADIAQGLCEIRIGSVERGLDLVERALTSSVADAGPYRAEALKALVRAYDEAGRPEQALDCLRELLCYIRSVRERSVLALFSQSIYPISDQCPVEMQDLQVLARKEAELRAQVAERQLVASQVEMLERLAITADLRDEATGQHGYRVGALSALLAQELGLPRNICFDIELAARLHDIGKIGVPDRILLSPKILVEAERQFVAAHTSIGSEILSKSNLPQLRMAEEIARFHHEWWNGEGYPSGLREKRIPLHARIVALADVFDALTHGRPFASPWSVDDALNEIASRRGIQFDPQLTDVFLALVRRLSDEHPDLHEFLAKAGQSSPFLQARKRIQEMLASERANEEISGIAAGKTRH
jgi:tetratricopeptide (TPR) repeat protein